MTECEWCGEHAPEWECGFCGAKGCKVCIKDPDLHECEHEKKERDKRKDKRATSQEKQEPLDVDDF